MAVAPKQQQHIAAVRSRNRPEVDLAGLERALHDQIEGEVRFDAGSRALYAHDASNYRQAPLGVVVPKTIEDVVATVAAAREFGAPILSRGGGTSLAGQCCNVAVVLDFSKYLNEVLEIDVEKKLARVQPGIVLDDLRKATERHGLTFGPDPSTHGWCTLGGMIGNNSCGVHSVMSGRTADNVEALDILTYDGERFWVGRTDDEEWDAYVAEGGRRGAIYAGLREIRQQYAEEIRQRFPDIPRRVSGYNLGELLPGKGCNVARALVGSEGTCVVVLQAVLNLVPHRGERTLVVLGYPDVYSAADHVPEILEHGPVGIEGLDRELVQFEEKKNMNVEDRELLPEGDGFLLVEFGADEKADADAQAQRLVDALEKHDDAPRAATFRDAGKSAQLWEIRESGLGATAKVPGMDDTWPGWEDAAVDPANLGDYLREFRALLDEFDYSASLYGHFGEGCIHCRINFNLRTKEGVDKYLRFVDRAADLVLKYNGSFSGEHGDGQARGFLLPKMFGEDLVEAFRKFKTLWDPDWMMNPGKLVDADPPDTHLQLGPDYRPWLADTHFAYTADEGSMSEAALRCVGVGKCRRRHDAFMCPSFVATREEKDSTRGRARMLVEMFTGDVVTGGWKSQEVYDALDLCLGCKGCKKECPINVDMATYKAEFLSHYYDGRVRPRVHYAMGLISWWARIASVMPGAANVLSQREPFARLLKKTGGIAPQRQMPKFARQTFQSWFKNNHRPKNPDGKIVVLYPDVYNNHFHPEVLRAGLNVLERLGYQVLVPEPYLHAPRPLIHYGMLDAAKKQIRRIVDVLQPHVREDRPIIGLEPTTVAVFRDDALSLLPNDEDVRRLSYNTHLLSTFLQLEDVSLPTLKGKVLYHGHCHQKAVLEDGMVQDLIRKMAVEIIEPEQGCCGMAGAFGFEAEHYEIAVKVGDNHLLPAVRKLDARTPILVEGFSCREQIRDLANRDPIHVAEFIAHAFDRAAG